MDTAMACNLRRIVLVGVLAAGVVASSPGRGRALHRDGGIGGGAFFGEPGTLRVLDLNADQEEAVRLAWQMHSATLRQLAATDKAARHAIDDRLLARGEVTQQNLEGLVEQEIQAHGALTRERLATALDVRNALTPDQIQQVATIRASVDHARARMHGLDLKLLAPR